MKKGLLLCAAALLIGCPVAEHVNPAPLPEDSVGDGGYDQTSDEDGVGGSGGEGLLGNGGAIDNPGPGDSGGSGGNNEAGGSGGTAGFGGSEFGGFTGDDSCRDKEAKDLEGHCHGHNHGHHEDHKHHGPKDD